MVSTLLAVGLMAGQPSPHPLALPEQANAIRRVGTGPRRLRADFAAPDAVLVVYTENWPGLFDRLVDTVALSASVYVVREDSISLPTVRAWHGRLEERTRDRVTVLDLTTSSPWLRDYGPIQVREAEGMTWIDAEYGSERAADDALPEQLEPLFGPSREPYAMDIDGGAFISNGRGLCVAVREYFELHGPDLTDDAGLDTLQRTLGCPTLVLVSGPDGEGAHHADMIGQFVAPDTLVWATSERSDDRRKLDAALQTITAASHSMGLSLRSVRVPSHYGPTDRYWSYANFIQTGNSIAVPQYGEGAGPLDLAALGAIRAANPRAHVVPIDTTEAAQLGGALHCVTLGIEW